MLLLQKVSFFLASFLHHSTDFLFWFLLPPNFWNLLSTLFISHYFLPLAVSDLCKFFLSILKASSIWSFLGLWSCFPLFLSYCRPSAFPLPDILFSRVVELLLSVHQRGVNYWWAQSLCLESQHSLWSLPCYFWFLYNKCILEASFLLLRLVMFSGPLPFKAWESVWCWRGWSYQPPMHACMYVHVYMCACMRAHAFVRGWRLKTGVPSVSPESWVSC